MKHSLLFFTGLVFSLFTGAQTAVDFNVADCSGTIHHLYGELDAGKVIVLDFVMPCSACVGPSMTTYNMVQSYASSNPGKVKFYLSSDDGTDACSAISSWGSANSLTSPDAVFAASMVKESVYGSGGMPKIVVMGGASHHVFMIANSSVNITTLQTAIDSAIIASSATTVSTVKEKNNALSLFPNPVSANSKLIYSLEMPSLVTIKIVNILGIEVKTIFQGDLSSGNHSAEVDCSDISNGIYFARISSGDRTRTLKFFVKH